VKGDGISSEYHARLRTDKPAKPFRTRTRRHRNLSRLRVHVRVRIDHAPARIGETGADRLVVAAPPLGLVALAVADIRASRAACLRDTVAE
jgi:hypothetical protein